MVVSVGNDGDEQPGGGGTVAGSDMRSDVRSGGRHRLLLIDAQPDWAHQARDIDPAQNSPLLDGVTQSLPCFMFNSTTSTIVEYK